jgi:hypothetical protein
MFPTDAGIVALCAGIAGTAAVAEILIAAFVLSFLLASGSAQALRRQPIRSTATNRRNYR